MNNANQSVIEIHDKALSEVDTAYHQFLLTYKKSDKCVYGFCEGKDDPSFYQSLLESRLPREWKVRLIPAGGKDKVLQTYNSIQWINHSKQRICFFVDRDLSDFIGDPRQVESNIYITDGYSIENSIYDSMLLCHVLSDVYQISNLGLAEEEKIVDIFQRNFNQFVCAMLPLMGQILLWKRAKIKPNPNFSNLKLSEIFKFADHTVIPVSRDDLLDIASKHIGCPLNSNEEILTAEIEVSSQQISSMIIRGKYLTWFMLRQCEAIWASIPAIINRFAACPTKRIECGIKNANILFAPRARLPESLSIFISDNYLQFINSELN